MGVIQNSINSMLGTANQTVGIAKVGKELKAKAESDAIGAQMGYNKDVQPLVKGIERSKTALEVSEAEAEFQKGERDEALENMEAELKKVGGPKEAEGRREWAKNMFGAYPEERFDEKMYSFWDNQSTIAQQRLESLQDTIRGQKKALENRMNSFLDQEPLAAQYYGIKNKNLVRVDLGGKK